MLSIIVAGETIFMLPFLIPRLFRPLMLEAWGLTNTDIGAAFGAYGFSSMISYILGGPFADKYPPRSLISISLFITALGAAGLLIFPSRMTLIMTYFFFGISTILLMWGALIKVTHVIGGESNRAGAMGVLDSGRGLTAALMSTLLVAVISATFSDEQMKTNQLFAVNIIYAITMGITILVSAVVWVSLKNYQTASSEKRDWTIDKAKKVLKDSRVWLQGIVILSAYCGYKSIDNYSVYLVDVHKVELIKSSQFTSIIFWLRPVSALIAGFLADRVRVQFDGGRFLTLFVLLIGGAIFQIFLATSLFPIFNMVFGTILLSAAFAYAMRAIYFAVFGSIDVPENLVGTTVGIVSLVGFLPDMFFGVLTGYLIDNFPNGMGYTYTFYFTSFCLMLGAVACFLNYRKVK